MSILMGGSGSTGSSLLQNILNRHEAIFAGPETRLFMYPHLFDKWDRYKKHLLSGGPLGVKSTGWSLRNRADLLQEAYGWERKELEEVLFKSNSFKSFVADFFEKPLSINKAQVWIEKTPQNAYGFRAFLENYPNGKVIQTLRDPYDTMASLMARGFTSYDAAGIYIYHTAVASSLSDHDRYFEILYKDLVSIPLDSISKLFQFLDLPFDPKILEPTNAEKSKPLKLKGWNHSERDKIKSSSIGRFHSLPEEQRLEIIAALNSLEISKAHLDYHKIQFSDFKSICEKHGFDFLQTDTRPFLKKFRRLRTKDIIWRTYRMHPTNFMFYPGCLKSSV